MPPLTPASAGPRTASWRSSVTAPSTPRPTRPPTGISVISLKKPAVPNTPASTDIDWDDIHLRVFQPTTMEVVEGAISSDGSRIAFRSQQNGDDLWVATVDGKEVTRL